MYKSNSIHLVVRQIRPKEFRTPRFI